MSRMTGEPLNELKTSAPPSPDSDRHRRRPTTTRDDAGRQPTTTHADPRASVNAAAARRPQREARDIGEVSPFGEGWCGRETSPKGPVRGDREVGSGGLASSAVYKRQGACIDHKQQIIQSRLTIEEKIPELHSKTL